MLGAMWGAEDSSQPMLLWNIPSGKYGPFLLNALVGNASTSHLSRQPDAQGLWSQSDMDLNCRNVFEASHMNPKMHLNFELFRYIWFLLL